MIDNVLDIMENGSSPVSHLGELFGGCGSEFFEEVCLCDTLDQTPSLPLMRVRS